MHVNLAAGFAGGASRSIQPEDDFASLSEVAVATMAFCRWTEAQFRATFL
jgi:hypothetical protein